VKLRRDEFSREDVPGEGKSISRSWKRVLRRDGFLRKVWCNRMLRRGTFRRKVKRTFVSRIGIRRDVKIGGRCKQGNEQSFLVPDVFNFPPKFYNFLP